MICIRWSWQRWQSSPRHTGTCSRVSAALLLGPACCLDVICTVAVMRCVLVTAPASFSPSVVTKA